MSVLNLKKKSEMAFIQSAIDSTRRLRNATLHNNHIITNISNPQAEIEIEEYCKNNLLPLASKIDKNRSKNVMNLERILKNRTVSDFFMMIFLADNVVKSNGILRNINKEINQFFNERCFRKGYRRLFAKNPHLIKFACIFYRTFKSVEKMLKWNTIKRNYNFIDAH